MEGSATQSTYTGEAAEGEIGDVDVPTSVEESSLPSTGGSNESTGQGNVAKWLEKVDQSSLFAATATAETPDSCVDTKKRQQDDEDEAAGERPTKRLCGQTGLDESWPSPDNLGDPKVSETLRIPLLIAKARLTHKRSQWHQTAPLSLQEHAGIEGVPNITYAGLHLWIHATEKIETMQIWLESTASPEQIVFKAELDHAKKMVNFLELMGGKSASQG
ncbi:MAG: hypothetical protein LQ338_003091 [Usnochroma carphineum]|nr:MAG: hypothetical protein LQ338_003091 [Usnochroma carphineum]